MTERPLAPLRCGHQLVQREVKGRIMTVSRSTLSNRSLPSRKGPQTQTGLADIGMIRARGVPGVDVGWSVAGRGRARAVEE